MRVISSFRPSPSASSLSPSSSLLASPVLLPLLRRDVFTSSSSSSGVDVPIPKSFAIRASEGFRCVGGGGREELDPVGEKRAALGRRSDMRWPRGCYGCRRVGVGERRCDTCDGEFSKIGDERWEGFVLMQRTAV